MIKKEIYIVLLGKLSSEYCERLESSVIWSDRVLIKQAQWGKRERESPEVSTKFLTSLIRVVSLFKVSQVCS